MEKKRIGCFDIAKGIGILMVVWAHARGPYTAYIYQFHMPLFFLISGYLFNPNNSFWQFTVRKLQSLYIPFIFWNLAALCIKTAVGLSNLPPEVFLEKTIKMLLTMEKDGQFFGATWFLSALFIESILYKALDELLKRVPYRRWIITICFAIGAIVGFRINFPYMLSRTMVLGVFFAIGYVIKENQERLALFWKWYLAVIFFGLFVLIGRHGHANMGMNDYSSTVLFVIGSCMMSYAVLYLSYFIDQKKGVISKNINRLLCFLGKRSIDIVIWQFVFFRIVIALQLYIHHKPVNVSEVLKYYPVYETSGGWWAVYTVVGLFVPILWCSLLKSGIWGKLFKRMHIV